MHETPFAPERIVAALNAAGVAYVIVGGLAVAAHGVVRATRQRDLVPEPSADNLDRLFFATTGATHERARGTRCRRAAAAERYGSPAA